MNLTLLISPRRRSPNLKPLVPWHILLYELGLVSLTLYGWVSKRCILFYCEIIIPFKVQTNGFFCLSFAAYLLLQVVLCSYYHNSD